MSRRTLEEHADEAKSCALCRSLATFILDGHTPLCADHVELAMDYDPPARPSGAYGTQLSTVDGVEVSTVDTRAGISRAETNLSRCAYTHLPVDLLPSEARHATR